MAVAPTADGLVRTRLRVAGIVQGVGFRPYVYRLARELELAGFVLNDSRGVLIEVEGSTRAVREFEARLPREAPPLAVLEGVHGQPISPRGAQGFSIAESDREGSADAAVSPDTATCEACLHELFDPADRRYRYPFINCTNCGPRFTIVRGVPYDRALTTMASFQMCDACRAEYENPLDRRFHAQPNACWECGPLLTLLGAQRRLIAGGDTALRGAAAALRAGAIIAVKGIGGYHLACRAADGEAVAELRSRKHREEKPFALMAPDLDSARALVRLTRIDCRLLTGPERPIVIARRRAQAHVAEAVAARSRELGVMLPYSPLHHLLLAGVGEPLVMTSGNVSDEPIAYQDDDAFRRLHGIADLFLVHDRAIETRTDDSVLRAVRHRRRPLLVRRSRGHVPAEVRLPVAGARPVLGCGAELKSTFCLARDERAWVSHHIGDLENYETLRSFEDGIRHFARLFSVQPLLVAHDLHPEYLSTKYARARDELEPVAVQHHHAHLAGCLAEHGEEGPAIGAIFDGTGYGTDGSIWGGELLVGGLRDFERVGHLWPVPLPGGERAVREPWRMACAWMTAAAGEDAPAPPRLAGMIEAEAWRRVQRLCTNAVAAPITTSMGRLFDAVAALCGLRLTVSYEGQAAVELEALSDPAQTGAYPLPLITVAGSTVLDPRAMIEALIADLDSHTPVATVAARVHNTLAGATVAACEKIARRRHLSTVVLSGGCFQNALLLEKVSAQLVRAGLRVLVPERLPPNDGGISFGQVAVAAARDAAFVREGASG
jgi:hydrogenase maturation protein HypF